MAPQAAPARPAARLPAEGMLDLDFEEKAGEDPRYLSSQLITYLGNKRALLPQIELAAKEARSRLGGRRLSVLDAFAGSGVVSRLFKRHASVLHSNDFEAYARVIAECYLADASSADLAAVAEIADELNRRYEEGHRQPGFFSEMYAPSSLDEVRPGERCFYTPDNAQRLDTFRADLDSVPDHLRVFLLAPLLSAASRHVNTGGVFKGFYKDRSGVGKFGGQAGNALQRILSPIRMEAPQLSRFACESVVHQMDANTLVDSLDEVDLVYMDPPYNEHPYGSNYFMLNLLVSNERPAVVSEVSGIPADWQRSAYNRRKEAFTAFQDFTARVRARFLLVSYSDEGFISPCDMAEHLRSLGDVMEIRTSYSTYKASRNLADRSLQVTEHLYLVDRGRA